MLRFLGELYTNSEQHKLEIFFSIFVEGTHFTKDSEIVMCIITDSTVLLNVLDL